MNIVEVVPILKEFLKERLEDPLSQRKHEWIYDDEFRADLAKSSLPRIAILLKELLKTRLGIGSIRSFETAKIDFLIKVNVGRKYIYNNQQLNAMDMATRMGADIEEFIKENHAYFVAKGIQSVLPISSKDGYDQNKDAVVTLTVEVKFVN
jgi:hypothetical protein